MKNDFAETHHRSIKNNKIVFVHSKNSSQKKNTSTAAPVIISFNKERDNF
jgi:hypothetical protein